MNRDVKRMTRVGLSIAALLLPVLAASCSMRKPAQEKVAEAPSRPTPPPPPPGDLKIGTWPGYPPLAMKKGGKLQGVEPEFAEKLGGELKRRIRLVELKWDELIPALRDGRIDIIMSGMSVTEDRKRLVSFAEPYLRIGQMALIRKRDEKKFQDPTSIDQKKTRIGFQSDTTGEYFVRDRMKSAKLVGFSSIEKGIAALRRRNIDIFVHDAPTIWRVTGGFTSKEKQLIGRYDLLTDEPLAWAVRREDSDLRDELSAIVRKWRDDCKLDEVLDHWIPVRKMKAYIAPAQ